MKLRTLIATIALATSAAVGATSAATVTATFEGTIFSAGGAFAGANGQALTAVIIGDDDVPALPLSTAPSYVSSAQERSAYRLTSFQTRVPGVGLDVTLTDPIMWVGDNVSGFAASPVDIIGIEAFDAASSQSLLFVASFVGTTFSGTELGIAVSEGLARTQTLTETVSYSLSSGQDFGFLTANTGLSTFIIDPGSPGGGGGGGGGNAGGGTGGVSPVPLPAGLPLLLLGLGTLGFVRRASKKTEG